MMRLSQPARRPAVVAVKVAIALPALLGVVALALDAGLIYDRKRHTQAAADAAALAAAAKLFETYTNSSTSDDGKDGSGAAAAQARSVAAANGYPNDGTTATVTVNIPPTSGQYAGLDGYAEVLVGYNQNRGFSSIFGTGDLVVGSRAVARGRWTGTQIGILVLDPSGAWALKVSGEAIGYVPNASVIVNSTHSQAAYGEGTNAKLTAKSFEITGNYYENGGNQFIGTKRTGVPPTPDPFRDLPEPNPATMTPRSKDTATVVNHGSGYKTYYLEPGVYDGGLYFDGKSSVVMAPGIYYMRGTAGSGGFKFRGSDTTSLKAEGVMVFNDKGNNTDNPNVDITGNAVVTWTPPTSGIYKGMSFFQARNQTMTAYIAGGGGMNIKGALYFRDALVDIAGNGESYIGNQFISYRLSMRGNGTYQVPWEAGQVPSVRDLRIVE